MVMLQRWSLMEGEWSGRMRIIVTEVASLMEGEWSCYRGGQFNGGRLVMLQKWMEGNGHVTEVV